MKSTHIKALLIASGVAALALGGTVAGTFALFQRNTQVVTHVKVGNLNFKFSRTNLKYKALSDSTGYLEEKEDKAVVDLSEDGSKAFDLASLAPGSEVASTFELENIGGTAFKTSLDLLNVDIKKDGVTATSVDWLQYVSVSLIEGEKKTDFTLKDLKTVSLIDLPKGQKTSFVMKLSFDAEHIENEAQDHDLSFAIRLSCTQLLTQA